jgi:UDP-N-acetylglucosamine 2-epimerase (non-hydrolysing)
MKILSVFGTRPEAIKFAPVLAELARRRNLKSRVCVTAQHRGLLDQVLDIFGIKPDYDLDIMRPGQALPDLTARLIAGLAPVVARERPDAILVQGDTTTCFAAAMCGYYEKVPVGHIEAGLRTGDLYSPFPEEGNRRLVDAIATWRYAPTSRSRDLLLAEGCPSDSVLVTGNTVVDAILWAQKRARSIRPPLPVRIGKKRLVLVTAHRRESFGQGIANICHAIAAIARMAPDVVVVFPIHPNPNVREPAGRIFAQADPNRIRIIDPLDYLTFVRLMDRAELILTDSGGIQEEAASLGIPLLVARDKTERPEVLDVPTTEVVGTEEAPISRAALRWLKRGKLRRRDPRKGPFGDGRAAKRIADHLEGLSHCQA